MIAWASISGAPKISSGRVAIRRQRAQPADMYRQTFRLLNGMQGRRHAGRIARTPVDAAPHLLQPMPLHIVVQQGAGYALGTQKSRRTQAACGPMLEHLV